MQREEEERRQLTQLQNEQNKASGESEEENEDDETVPSTSSKAKQNAFDFLNAAEDEDDSEEEEPGQPDESDPTNVAEDRSKAPASSTKISSSQQKRKRAKKKKKTPKSDSKTKIEENAKLDEIDLALKSLSANDKESKNAEQVYRPDPELTAFYELLSIDSKNLNALNEMKKLFGSTVIEGRSEVDGGAGRRRGRGPIQLDLGAALAGRNSPVSRGQGLAGLALKRNVFIPGKEEWPKATSGGLGMELVERAVDFTTEYRFVHTPIYQEIQRQFELCAESMDPQRMIALLQRHPYHISSLLQVAEIAKHQGDHSVSVDLLERALFTFGRSVHSSFHTAVSQGKARLDFRRPENREFWLAAYRYIGTLGQRGTWRTAFEWAKLILSLDPESDHYSMRLIIDQLALRGGQFEHLLRLASTPGSVIDWGQYSPNILISVAMAHHKLKNSDQARTTLGFAVAHYPWIIARMYKELDIEPIPKSVWGSQPRTDREELLSSAYVLRAKDIWSTPEALSLLKEVVESAERVEPPAADAAEEVSLDEARHILLSEMPALIGLLPREITRARMSSSDPLPPEDNLPSYTINSEPMDEDWEQEMQADEREFQGIRSWFTGMLSRLGVNVNFNNSNGAGPDDFPIDEVASALEDSGVDINELAERTSRLEALRGRQLAAEERLRGLENDLNDMDARAREAGFVDASAPAPVINTATEAQAPSNQAASTGSSTYDDEANQRWLAGRGMLRLKDFIAQHGSNENVWKDNLDIDVTPATEYAHRVTQLQKRASKDFILNYSLKQGAGAEASDLVKRLIGA